MTDPERPKVRRERRQCKNPGATQFNRVYSKRNPRSLKNAADVDLLITLGLTRQAATSLMEEIGSLENYTSIGEGHNMLDRPGIGKATAVKLDALYEFAARVG